MLAEAPQEDWRVVLCCLTDKGRRLTGSQWNPTIVEIRSRMERLTYRQLLGFRRAAKAMLQAFKEIGESSQSNQEQLGE